MLTWTVYVNDVLFDVMTDEEVEDLLGSWKATWIDRERGVIEFD